MSESRRIPNACQISPKRSATTSTSSPSANTDHHTQAFTGFPSRSNSSRSASSVVSIAIPLSPTATPPSPTRLAATAVAPILAWSTSLKRKSCPHRVLRKLQIRPRSNSDCDSGRDVILVSEIQHPQRTRLTRFFPFFFDRRKIYILHTFPSKSTKYILRETDKSHKFSSDTESDNSVYRSRCKPADCKPNCEADPIRLRSVFQKPIQQTKYEKCRH